MKLNLRVWRQRNADADGAMSTYEVDGISPDMSFLEMLDTLNEELILQGEDPVAFDHDCREGICGACSLVINGDAHGPERTTTCQLHMRSFRDGDTIDVPNGWEDFIIHTALLKLDEREERPTGERLAAIERSRQRIIRAAEDRNTAEPDYIPFPGEELTRWIP